jgi:hypothetical protein
MGKLDCFFIDGIDCWFWSSDHRPPHFNAKRRGEWQVRVFFMNKKAEMIEQVRRSGRISRAHRRMLGDMAEQHREDLLKEWEKKVKYDD